MDAELLVEAMLEIVDGLFGKAEFGSDVRRSEAMGSQSQDFPLACGKVDEAAQAVKRDMDRNTDHVCGVRCMTAQAAEGFIHYGADDS
jgi:hypothetical protein